MQTKDHAVQAMIDWIEEHLAEAQTLLPMSAAVGYSPWYASQLFHQVSGQTLKRYVAGRRLTIATLALRDTNARILDIALDAGYASQEALSRAFRAAFGLTPQAYRKSPVPLALPIRQTVLFPNNEKGAHTMSNQTILTEAGVRVEYIPAHRFIGIWDDRVSDYMSFWEYHDCDTVTGTVDSMSHVTDPVVTAHTAGWTANANGKPGYFYGFGVPADYTGPVPEGFEMRDVPASYYLVFYHPAFDFMEDCAAVMSRVEEKAKAFDPATQGFAWREDMPAYQRHMPETIGYEVLRPVRKA